MNVYSGNLNAKDLKLLILKSRSNSMLTEQLLKGAVETFEQLGGNKQNLDVAIVPTVFDFCSVLKQTSVFGYSAIVCLGAEYATCTATCTESLLRTFMSQAASCPIPVSNGIVIGTVLEELINECGTKAGNRGSEAMKNAIEMVDLLNKLSHNLVTEIP